MKWEVGGGGGGERKKMPKRPKSCTIYVATDKWEV